ncbi:hypothetical protein [Erwinia sp. 198]|uniref:hypothetical protein n=1 Tax=Erwinia sp. 198 TaxID=2022746 RepID=UPI000F672B8E|nr:hypothetical protein [Erwinia sp. 198]RRZ96947.1 hypothetical protein EGK14_01225 [Erwinia sp. 198]
MKPKMRPVVGLAITLLLAGCDRSETQPVKFINPEKVMQDSGLAEQLKTRLQAVDKKLQQGLEMAQENGARLPEEKRRSALLADRQLLDLEWQHEQRRANGVVMKAIAEAAGEYRQQHQLLAILPTQAALAFAPEADISEALAKTLKGKTLDFGALPKIGVKSEEPASAEASKQ